MRNDNEPLKILSLAQHFDAPESYAGCFGWLCGYSADAAFLRDAVERFTGISSSQCSNLGRIALAVLLDPGNPQISPADVPGIAHLPIQALTPKPFRLLHAKIALLAFQHRENRKAWHLRLIVSTGNWTRQTLESSLDLAWRVDISSEDMTVKPLDEEKQRVCADIKAANNFLLEVAGWFDTSLLEATPDDKFSETKNAKETFQAWVSDCSKNAKGSARLFDNRKKSLLSQLSDKIKDSGKHSARNYLAMGSGFYESSNAGNSPDVPVKIINALKEQGLLTHKPEIDVYVNPVACQAIAYSLTSLRDQGITVRPANSPSLVFGENSSRSLHAKFLFSANYRDNSPSCNSAWVYLGSGNLTGPGFVKKMNSENGNLEAGVVFAPENLLWKSKKKNDQKHVITNLLPIHWEKTIDDETSLKPGSDMEPPKDFYLASPVPWLFWQDNPPELRAPKDFPIPSDFIVFDTMGNECKKTGFAFQWPGKQPKQVRCCWESENGRHENFLAVVDQFGRIAATEPQPIDFDEAWLQLMDFPQPPDEDREVEYGEDDIDVGGQSKSTASQTGNYPIRKMMALIENIANKQTRVSEQDWPLWCKRLEQILSQARDDEVVKYFTEKLKLNPLSPLRQQAFRPGFAEGADSKEGEMYQSVFEHIEKIWKCGELPPIGRL